MSDADTAPQSNALAVVGFILSIVFCWSVFVPILSEVLYVAALFLSGAGISRAKAGGPLHGLAVAGVTLSVIGFVVAVSLSLLMVAG